MTADSAAPVTSGVVRFDRDEAFWLEWERQWLLYGTVYAINNPEPRVVPAATLTIHEGPCPAVAVSARPHATETLDRAVLRELAESYRASRDQSLNGWQLDNLRKAVLDYLDAVSAREGEPAILMRAAATLELVLELQRQRGRMSKVTVEDMVRVTRIVDAHCPRAPLREAGGRPMTTIDREALAAAVKAMPHIQGTTMVDDFAVLDLVAAAPAVSSGLDVDRLARALHEYGKLSGEPEDHYIEVNSDEIAEEVAREYDRETT